jgi:hypothetical protein
MYFIFWSALLTLLPLTVISFPQLVVQYKSWFQMLQMDHSSSLGISILGWLQSWFQVAASKTGLLALGILFLLLPLLRIRHFVDFQFRILYLASILIWIVIFNHKAESPTFIIAVCGAAIWFFTQKISITNIVLITLVFILASLSPTDLFPKYIRNNFIVPYVLKVVPLIFIWVKMTYELLTNKYNQCLVTFQK